MRPVVSWNGVKRGSSHRRSLCLCFTTVATFGCAQFQAKHSTPRRSLSLPWYVRAQLAAGRAQLAAGRTQQAWRKRRYSASAQGSGGGMLGVVLGQELGGATLTAKQMLRLCWLVTLFHKSDNPPRTSLG